MKKGFEIFFIVLLMVFIFSVSFASANIFSDFFNKLGGKKIYLSPAETINNAGFESALNSATDWSSSGINVSKDSAQKHSGTSSLKIIGRGFSLNHPDVLKNAAGKKFTLTLWAKSDGSVLKITNKVGVQSSATNLGLVNGSGINFAGISSEWKQFSSTFTLPIDANVNYHILLATEPTNLGTIWFDDISLVEITSPVVPPTTTSCLWPPTTSGVKMAESNNLMNWYGTIENRILCYNGKWYVSYSRDASDISQYKQSATNPNGYIVKQEREIIGNWTLNNGIWQKPVPVNTTNVTCTDSDGGLDYYVKGEVSGNIGSGYPNEVQTYSDFCLSEVPHNYGTNNTLIERYCGTNYTDFTKSYECPNGCEDGACLKETETIFVKHKQEFEARWDGDGYGEIHKLTLQIKKDSSPPNLFYAEIWDDNGNLVCDNLIVGDYCEVGYAQIKVVGINSAGEDVELQGIGETELSVLNCIPRYYCQVSPTICPKSGVQTKECQDFECETPGYTEEVQCNPGECAGCELEGKCIPYGFRTGVKVYNNNPGNYNLYCDIDGELKEQKTKDSNGEWATCQNNYECESNVCSSGECYEIQDMINQASAIKTFFVKIMCKIANPFTDEEYKKCLINFLGEEKKI